MSTQITPKHTHKIQNMSDCNCNLCYSQQNTVPLRSLDIPPGASSGVAAALDCPTPLDLRPSTGPPPENTNKREPSVKLLYFIRAEYKI